MTTILAICFLAVIKLLCQEAHGFCYLPCPRSTPRNAVCAVDSSRGAKLFSGMCQLWQENHCNSAAYKELDMAVCLERYPHVVSDFVSANGLAPRFELGRSTYGMRPLPRFIFLGNVVVRLAETRPWLIPILPTFGVYQLPFPMWPALN